MTKRLLLIVDVQKGFLNAWTEHIPKRVEILQESFDRVIATRFVNPEGSPYRRLLGWTRFAPDSEDMRLAFTPRSDARVIDKPVYTCVTANFLAGLRAEKISTVHLAGIATENCVLKCAVDLFEAGIEPIVLAGACASHGGLDCHQAGIKIIKRFIGDERVEA